MAEPTSVRDWRTLYTAAMLEHDSTCVQPRIEKAEKAIHVRLRELSETSVVGSENEELHSALKYLCRLKDNQTFG